MTIAKPGELIIQLAQGDDAGEFVVGLNRRTGELRLAIEGFIDAYTPEGDVQLAIPDCMMATGVVSVRLLGATWFTSDPLPEPEIVDLQIVRRIA